jgi:hypothetical protein
MGNVTRVALLNGELADEQIVLQSFKNFQRILLQDPVSLLKLLECAQNYTGPQAGCSDLNAEHGKAQTYKALRAMNHNNRFGDDLRALVAGELASITLPHPIRNSEKYDTRRYSE